MKSELLNKTPWHHCAIPNSSKRNQMFVKAAFYNKLSLINIFSYFLFIRNGGYRLGNYIPHQINQELSKDKQL